MTTLVERNENEVQERIPATHETVTVTVGDQQAEIDKGIAPLIEQIWIADISTINSCQETEPGWAWIEFLTWCAAEEFLTIVAGDFNSDPDSLYNRIRSSGSMTERSWQYTVLVVDCSVNVEVADTGTLEETPLDSPDFVYVVSIHFPITDIPVVERRMREYNNSNGRKAGRQSRESCNEGINSNE